MAMNYFVRDRYAIEMLTLTGKVERSQYQPALAVTGAWESSNRPILYEELGWETLSDRRMCRRILQVHKIINNKTTSRLKYKLHS